MSSFKESRWTTSIPNPPLLWQNPIGLLLESPFAKLNGFVEQTNKSLRESLMLEGAASRAVACLFKKGCLTTTEVGRERKSASRP